MTYAPLLGLVLFVAFGVPIAKGLAQAAHDSINYQPHAESPMR